MVEANAGSIGAIEHVAVLVRDLDRAMERYTNDLGIGPWAVYTLGPDWIRDMTVHGKEQGYVYTLALCSVGPVLYELMESVEGPNILEEFLDERGEGLHHLGYFVPDIDAEMSKMEAKGYPLLQSGRGFGKDGDGDYALFDTEIACGCILEALEMPQEMPPPTGPTRRTRANPPRPRRLLRGGECNRSPLCAGNGEDPISDNWAFSETAR